MIIMLLGPGVMLAVAVNSSIARYNSIALLFLFGVIQTVSKPYFITPSITSKHFQRSNITNNFFVLQSLSDLLGRLRQSLPLKSVK